MQNDSLNLWLTPRLTHFTTLSSIQHADVSAHILWTGLRQPHSPAFSYLDKSNAKKRQRGFSLISLVSRTRNFREELPPWSKGSKSYVVQYWYVSRTEVCTRSTYRYSVVYTGRRETRNESLSLSLWKRLDYCHRWRGLERRRCCKCVNNRERCI